MVNGSIISVAHVNIHLFTVITEYFLTSLLNSARYSANDSCAATHRRSPRMSPTLSLAAFALDSTRATAPVQPKSTPKAFFPVMGSFRMIAERIIAKIGIEVVTTLELMGEVMLSPMV